MEKKITSGTTISPWLKLQPNEYTSLAEDIQTEICIIGAGMAGLSIAYRLADTGKKVVVIDSGLIGSGETGRTTAHLSNALDDRFYKIAKLHGIETAKLAAQSHTAAINYIEAIVQEEKIDCDFLRLDGYLFLGSNDSRDEIYKEEKAAIAAGIEDVVVCDNTQIFGQTRKLTLKFPRQAQFHPMKYLVGLANALIKKGGKIYTSTQAVEIIPGKPIEIKTNTGQKIYCNNLVVATNAPIYDKTLSFTKQESNRTYAIGCLVKKDSVPFALYWDNETPYHYVRLQPYDNLHDLLIIGGEDHRTGKQTSENEPFKNLETWSRTHFPEISSIEYKWSGQIQEPVDFLAYIGRLPKENKNIFIATGDSGHGMTHATIAALLIDDLIDNKANPWEKIYSPERSGFKNILSFINHNIKSVGSYFGYLLPGEVNSVDDIKNEEGAILRTGAKKIAVYRDVQGVLHEFSAACSHMNAPLSWNPIEKTWDCPAHSSRFSACGKTVQGPAISSLKPCNK